MSNSTSNIVIIGSMNISALPDNMKALSRIDDLIYTSTPTSKNLYDAFIESLMDEMTSMDFTSSLGQDDFSVYQVYGGDILFGETLKDKEDILEYKVILNIDHNDSDEDFCVDDIPVKLSTDALRRMIATRTQNHLNQNFLSFDYACEASQGNNETFHVDVNIKRINIEDED